LGSNETNANSCGLHGGLNQSDNLLNNYVALLLQAFYHTGACDALTILATTTEEGSQINM
jgi:hypothetical protein